MSVLGKEKPLLFFCDPEEDYTNRMAEFLAEHKDLPWKIQVFTNTKLLKSQLVEPEMVVISESIYKEYEKDLENINHIVLAETGITCENPELYVDKYQPAEDVLRAILSIYSELGGAAGIHFRRVGATRFIGVYSPIRRCQQTTFALTLGQLLSEKYRVLYVNFESYVGVDELRPFVQDKDLADLLYYMIADNDRFRLRFQVIKKSIGTMDYIPAMRSSKNILAVSEEEWMRFISKIEELGEYDFVVMDLSECMQGLFEILRICSCIYTIIKNEKIAISKLYQYEQLLKSYEYEDVLEKTSKCQLPKLYQIPDSVGMYYRGEMSEYVQKCIRDIEEKGILGEESEE